MTRLKAVIFVFIVVLVAHRFSGNNSSDHYPVSDTNWYLHTASSLLHRGNARLDEYRSLVEANASYGTIEKDGHIYNYFPLGTSLVVLPFVAILDSVAYNVYGFKFDKHLQGTTGRRTQVSVASLIVAMTAVIVLLIGEELSLSLTQSMILSFLFAFCSPAWSTASRALWAHGPSMLLLALSLWLFVVGKHHRLAVCLTAIPLALSCIVRPTNIISCAVFSFAILWSNRSCFILYGTLLTACFALFCLYNYSVYQAIIPSYYNPTRIGTNTHFGEAIFANLISPSRGLLVWSPIYFLGVCAVNRNLWKQCGQTVMFPVGLLIIVLLHLFAVSTFNHWWGGHSIGPRFMSDMSVYMTVMLIPLVKLASMDGAKKLQCFVFVCLSCFSFCTHMLSTISEGASQWNLLPQNIDEAPARVWDWTDVQFLRFAKGCWTK
jgi:hypothetical protein